MPVSIQRRNDAIFVGTGALEVTIELQPLRLAVSGSGLSIGPVAPAAVIDGVRRTAGPALGEPEVRDVETASGNATRIRVCAATDGPVELEITLELSSHSGGDPRGFLLDLGVTNRAPGPLAITSFEPWGTEDGATLEIAGDVGALRFLRMGYQSWSPAAWIPLGETDACARTPYLRSIWHGPFTPRPRRGRHVSDAVGTLRVAGGSGVTLGFVTCHRWLGHITLDHTGAHPRGLTAACAGESALVATGDTERCERLWVGLDEPGEDGLARWAERAGHEMGAPVPDHVETGWCSWYQYFTKVTAEAVRSNLVALGELEAPVDTVQIDDGFQAAVGDWLAFDAGFPDGVAPLAREIRAAGHRPGLWLAPLLVSRASRLYREHPDWLLRDRRGRPRVAQINPAWKGKICHALDPTHPRVLEWLEHVARAVVGFGFDYLKLDFLYAGTLPGRRSDRNLSTAAAYRGAIRAIRRGAGRDAFLLGCGAPLAPSIGLFEGMRIGPDTAPKWCHRVRDRVVGLPATPSAENAIRNTLVRAPLHGRLWANDPDCVLVRDRDTKLSDDEVKTVASVVALSGGMVLFSDDLANVSEHRRLLARRLLPTPGRAPEVTPGLAEVPGEIVSRQPDGSVFVLRVNLTDRPLEDARVDVRAIGFEAGAHVYEVWRERYLGIVRESVALGSIPAHGCALVRLSRVTDTPCVVGSNLHLLGGAIDVHAQSARGDALDVSLALPGVRNGRIAIAWPEPHRDGAVRVSFRDHGDLQFRVECNFGG